MSGLNSTPVPFEEGIVGTWEKFFHKRFRKRRDVSRALAVSILSPFLHDYVFVDPLGEVRPNMWYSFIAPSGFGNKTPPLVALRNIILNYKPSFDPERYILAPSRFTQQGFVTFVGGRKKSVDEDAQMEEIKPHPFCTLIRDEFSSFVADSRNNYMAGNDEFLSEVYDCFLQGYITRQFGFEGGIPIYCPAYTTSSTYFLQVVPHSFWLQGLGNRFSWLYDDREEFGVPEDFFFNFGDDSEMQELTRELYPNLEFLEKKRPFVTMGAGKKWIDWNNATLKPIINDKNVSELYKSYVAKQNKVALKLAIIYAASRFNFQSINFADHLLVDDGDMQRAIDDCMNFVGNFKVLQQKWLELQNQPREERVKTSRIDQQTILSYCQSIPSKLFTQPMVMNFLDTSDYRRVSEILGLFVAKGQIEVVEDEQIKQQFKKPRGPAPQVYRVIP